MAAKPPDLQQFMDFIGYRAETSNCPHRKPTGFRSKIQRSSANSYRLAQRPGSTVVIKVHRPVVKLEASEAPVCAATPASVIEGSRADMSFVAGRLIDKFAEHLPRRRQHQRLTDGGPPSARRG